MQRLIIVVRWLIGLPTRLIWWLFPKGMMQTALESQREQLSASRKALGRGRGAERRLTDQVQSCKTKIDRYGKAIERALADGDEEKAKRLATALNIYEQELVTNEKQLAEMTAANREAEHDLGRGCTALDALQQKSEMLGVRLDTSKIKRTVADTSAALRDTSGVGPLNDAMRNMEAQIYENEGVAQVTEGTSSLDQQLDEEETASAVEDILARYRKPVGNEITP